MRQVVQWDQPEIVTPTTDLTPSLMRPSPRFHCDYAAQSIREVAQNPTSAAFLPDYNVTGSVRSMRLENKLHKLPANRVDIIH